jgi:hypothetical protein
MRDPQNIRNESFIGSQSTAGKLAALWANKVPEKTGRVVSIKDTKIRGQNSFPNAKGAGTKTVTK